MAGDTADGAIGTTAAFEPAHVAGELDAAMCALIHARTDSSAGLARPRDMTVVVASSVENETGALVTALAPFFPAGTTAFPLCKAARDSVGCSDRRRGPAKKTKYKEIAPATVAGWLTRLGPADPEVDLGGAQRRAVVALAALGGGLPIGVTRGLRPEDIEMHDYRAVAGAAFAANFRGNRKVIRKRAVAAATSTTFAAASPLFPDHLAPYVQYAKEQEWDWLFPMLRDGVPFRSRRLGEEPMRALAREAAGDRKADFHSFRVGTARSLKFAHRRRDGPSAPVTQFVKNELQLRSNEAVGSFEVYDEGDAEACWKASWPIYGIRWTQAAGGGMSIFVDDLPYITGCRQHDDVRTGAVICARCDAQVAAEMPAWMCDDCDLWAICVRCSPTNPGDLNCPDHRVG